MSLPGTQTNPLPTTPLSSTRCHWRYLPNYNSLRMNAGLHYKPPYPATSYRNYMNNHMDILVHKSKRKLHKLPPYAERLISSVSCHTPPSFMYLEERLKVLPSIMPNFIHSQLEHNITTIRTYPDTLDKQYQQCHQSLQTHNFQDIQVLF